MDLGGEQPCAWGCIGRNVFVFQYVPNVGILRKYPIDLVRNGDRMLHAFLLRAEQKLFRASSVTHHRKA